MKINKRELFSAIAYPLGLAASFLFMSIISWRKWADILVDFGRELYIPWQLSSGLTLYKDLAHLFGPLSQYYHSFLFRICGTTYMTIICSNMIILIIFLCALYLLIDQVASRLTAFMSCGVVIYVFAFSQYIGIGNYNFISPYSHEATHGLVLSLLLICQLYLFQLRKKRFLLFTAGVSLGLVFLTKLEIFLSAAITVGFFFILLAAQERKLSVVISSVSVFLTGFVLPPCTFFSYFCKFMSAREALHSTLMASGIFLKKETVDNPFYISGMGFDNIAVNLLKLLLHTLIVLGILYIVYVLSRNLATQKIRGVKKYLIIGCLATVPIVSWFINPYQVGISLPALSLLSIIVILKYYISEAKKESNESDKIIPILLWAILSLLLLIKIVLNARLVHYGFYLALPSVVLIVIMTVWLLPTLMERHKYGGIFFRNTMIATIIVISSHFLLISANIYANKGFSVGSGFDRIITFSPGFDRIITFSPRIYDSGLYFTQAKSWIESNVAPNESIIVLPEGVMLNYMTKRINPTIYTNLMIPELSIYGEPSILKELVKHSPAYFVLVHKDTSEYGVGYFGADPRYGMEIMTWINSHYTPVALFGNEPFKGDRFGIKILKRNSC